MFRAIVISALLAIDLASSLPQSERWHSPDKFYSIVVPSNWTRVATKIRAHTTYRFISPDEQAEVAISATYNLDLPHALPDDVLATAFPNERAITTMKRLQGTVWDGLQREYANKEDSQRWLGIAARNGSTLVLVTMTAPRQSFEKFRTAFEKIGQSLMLGERAP